MSLCCTLRTWLVEFFLYFDDTVTQPEAENQAKELRIDGKGLYKVSPQQWLEIYGVQGQTIYNELQGSEIGYVRFLLCFGRLLSLEYEI